MLRNQTLILVVACTLSLAVGVSIAQLPGLSSKMVDSLKNRFRSSSRYPLAQRAPDVIHEYKQLEEEAPLELFIFHPERDGADEDTEHPQIAVIFFHGGGWTLGEPSQFFPHCTWLAEEGIECISAQYRTASTHCTSPLHAVEDAQDAYTYVREHRQTLGLTSKNLYAAGASAGAHLAATLATAHYPQFNIHRVYPDGIILLAAVIDNSKNGYGHERIKHFEPGFSPLHNLNKLFPRTLFLLGEMDRYVPVPTAEKFVSTLTTLGVDASLRVYDDAYHSFYIDEQYEQTMRDIETFLRSDTSD